MVKLLDIASIILIIINGILLITGILYLSLGTFMPYHIAFTGLTESDVSTYNSELMILIGIIFRLLGAGYINSGIVTIIVIIFAFRKGEKWAWFVVLISGAMNSIPNLVLTHIVLATNIMYLFPIISSILWIIAMVISGKEIFFTEKA